MNEIVGIRGGGDLATGVAWRLHKCGFKVFIMEIPKPMMVRRTVCFGEAVVEGITTVEDVTAVLLKECSLEAFGRLWSEKKIPVIVDSTGEAISIIKPKIVVDGILAKKNLGTTRSMADITIGMGPGFTAGEDVDYVIETMRGHYLGKVIDSGRAMADTGIPESVMGYTTERVVRAPEAGPYFSDKKIGDHVEKGECLGRVNSTAVIAEIKGVLRGSIADGTEVPLNMKIADIDPRDDNKYCNLISDKARAIGGGVLEAILRSLNEN